MIPTAPPEALIKLFVSKAAPSSVGLTLSGAPAPALPPVSPGPCPAFGEESGGVSSPPLASPASSPAASSPAGVGAGLLDLAPIGFRNGSSISNESSLYSSAPSDLAGDAIAIQRSASLLGIDRPAGRRRNVAGPVAVGHTLVELRKSWMLSPRHQRASQAT